MPKKTVVVYYQSCDPKQCEGGICLATLLCERKVLTQEDPYEMPEAKVSMCLSCSLCMLACLNGAVHVM
jgi:Fe-S-cluster-containing hydrogenase component 2